jgi:hypothetical protein
LIRLALFVGLLAGLSRTWADPDLWGHVRFGADILHDGWMRHDPYSFTSDIPWINHEWLAEVLMYAGWAVAGNAGLVGLKMAIVVATVTLIYAAIRLDPIASTARDLMLGATLLGLWARVFVVRPQLFSIVLYAALLSLLRAVERGKIARLWWLPALFGAWVNLHGGWIVGFATLTIWTGVALVRMPESAGPSRAHLIASVTVAGLATLVNPYGVHMWAFLLETVGTSRPDISDWRPLYESGLEVIAPWCAAAALAVAAIVRGWPRIPPAHLLMVLALGIMSVRVNRLDVFFTLSVICLLSPYVSTGERRVVEPFWSPRMRAAAVATLVAVLTAGYWNREALSCLRLDGPWMPEREAGAAIAASTAQGRLLAWFDWGQYAIWHFAPRLRVSIDGRRETVYSASLVARHLRIYFDPDANRNDVDSLDADYAWLPAELPLTAALERAGWTQLYSGARSTFLSRTAAAALAVPPLPHEACFPGP